MPRTKSLVAAAIAVITLAAGCANTHQRPPVELPPNAAPSRILDAKGRLITTIGEQNRESVPIAAVSEYAQNAVIAIEDSRFRSHNGVDPQAIGRAAVANVDAQQIAEGGSTITQQYVKNALLDDDRTISRKIEEATLAMALERNYSKDAILEQYLNTIYFGGGAYGIEAAAKTFFGVPAKELNIAQAALLAGIIQSPSRYNPHQNPENALARRNLVLERMNEQDYITDEELTFVRAVPLGVLPKADSGASQRSPAPHFVEEVKEWLLKESDALGSNQAERYANLLRGGLTVTTTIDLDLQALAEKAVRDVLPGQGENPKMPDAALVSVEPTTGFVKAMVGGHDFYGSHGYAMANLATGNGRQTGSVFKPVVAATAFSEGVSPSKRYPAPRSTSFTLNGGEVWNVKGGGIGSGTIEECTVVSSNTCFANIILDPAVGSEKSVETARKLGMTHTDLLAVPSAVLGANNATVQDMASVYGTFANGGIHVEPSYVTRVERNDGTVLFEHQHKQSKAIEPEVANQVNEILPKVLNDGGTGWRANIGRLAGGKTGSSQNNTDGWFCGYTAQLSTAVWVGFAELRANASGRAGLVSMTPPNTPITVFGGTYPAQIWKAFMGPAMEGQPELPLVKPPPSTPPTTATAASPDLLDQVPTRSATQVSMPDVAGLSRSEAISALEAEGLSPETYEISRLPDSDWDSVYAQSPTAGTLLRRGSTVWIEVTEKNPATTTAIPELRNATADDAARRLRELGLTVELRSSTAPTGAVDGNGALIAANRVWRTTPAAGSYSDDGTVVVEWSPTAAPTTTTTTATTTTTTAKPSATGPTTTRPRSTGR